MDTVSRSALILALAAAISAVPYHIVTSDNGVVAIKSSAAYAKDGSDDGPGDDSDRGNDDSGDSSDDSDNGDDSSDDGDDDGSSDDGDDSTDDGDDDGVDDGDDDSTDDSGSDDDHEYTFADGTKIEIENGVFERKDATGRTIEERPATARDRALLASAHGQGGTAAAPGRDHNRGGGVVAKFESDSTGIEVTYTDGWKEEIENGRYELKDSHNNTVIERVATNSDYARLTAASR